MSKTLKKSVLLVIIALGILFLGGTAVNAETTMSDTFKSILTDGKLVVPTIKPSSFEEAYAFISAYLFGIDGIEEGYIGTSYNDDFTECEITLNIDNENYESHIVEVVYQDCDNTIKSKIDAFVETIPDSKTFLLQDMEVVNFWISGYDVSNPVSIRKYMTNYSGELKEFLKNSNISVNFDTATGAGLDTELFSEVFGDAVLSYNGIGYSMKPFIGGRTENIIYVPDDTENTKEALLEAAQKRINDYLKNDNAVVLSYGGAFDTIQYYEDYKDEFGLTDVEHYFIAKVKNAEYKMLIVRDSSKMITPTYKTADLATNVQISSSASSIPLDTNLEAEKLTSGEEYERIIGLLDVEDAEVFDLNLYSDSLDEYIRQLDDGTFKVRIPMPDDFKGKDLAVYYVGTNGQPEVFEVETEDDYAVFTTNHFSIYTLGYKNIEPSPIKVIFDANGGKFGNETIYTIDDWKGELYDSLTKPTRDGYTFKGYYTEKTGGTKFEMILNESGIDEDMTFYAQWEKDSIEEEQPIEEEGDKTNDNNIVNTNTDKNSNAVNSNNPQTGDNIIVFIAIFVISLLGIVLTLVVRKQKNK